MTWKISAIAVPPIFTDADAKLSSLQQQHTTVSSRIDTAAAVFSDPKCAALNKALLGVYNRVLTHEMTGSEAHAAKVVTSGRQAYAAYHKGNEDMATDIEKSANSIPEPTITDGKKVPQ